mmetsp:Transcript_20403/g.45505  ORF Transcript_20403/g.45505 Transcript_20403/m.45505 type:complete len:97 (-) Transcript_20403:372-662(-)
MLCRIGAVPAGVRFPIVTIPPTMLLPVLPPAVVILPMAVIPPMMMLSSVLPRMVLPSRFSPMVIPPVLILSALASCAAGEWFRESEAGASQTTLLG